MATIKSDAANFLDEVMGTQLRRLGFSLVELLVVVCILGLLASGSLLAMSYPLKRAQRRAESAAVTGLHEWLRLRSRNSSGSLIVNFDQQTLTAKASLEGNNRREQRVVNFDSGVQLRALLSRGVVLESGVHELPYIHGRSPTFGLVTAQGNLTDSATAGSAERILLVCGPTGLIRDYRELAAVSAQRARTTKPPSSDSLNQPTEVTRAEVESALRRLARRIP